MIARRLLCLVVLTYFSIISISCYTQSTGLPLIHSSSSPGPLITLEVKDAKLSDVLKWIADQADLASGVEMGIPDDKISMRVKSAKLSDLMNDLCVAYECEWRVSDDRLVVTSKD